MSDLVGNPEDRFSRVEAHILLFFVLWLYLKCTIDFKAIYTLFLSGEHFTFVCF